MPNPDPASTMIPSLLSVLTLGAVAAALARPAFDGGVLESRPLFRFEEEGSIRPWRPVHDRVMGGVSSGSAGWSDGAARFTGLLSLDNNGGFASFRAARELPDLSEYDGVRLRVRGDGQVYQLGLRSGGRSRAVGWRAPFGTDRGEWTTVTLPFSDFAPTWRGRVVRDSGPIDASAFGEVSVVIADGQEGPFEIEVASIEAWRVERDAEPEEGTLAAALARTRSVAAAIDAGADARQLGDALRWSERLVVVAEPSRSGSLGAAASIQTARLLADGDGLAARELRVVRLTGDSVGRLAGRTLSREQVDGLRSLWKLPGDEWRVALVGKDGGVKASWTAPVAPAEIYARIDSMPMRLREIEARR